MENTSRWIIFTDADYDDDDDDDDEFMELY